MSPGNTNPPAPVINASAQSVSSGDSVTFTVSGTPPATSGGVTA